MAYWKEHPYKMTRKGQSSRYTGRAIVKLFARKFRRQLDKKAVREVV